MYLPSKAKGEARTEAVGRIAAALLASGLHIPDGTIQTTEDVVKQLKSEDTKVQTRWGIAQSAEIARIVEQEGLNMNALQSWVSIYAKREAARSEKKRRIFEERLADYIGQIISDPATTIEELQSKLRDATDGMEVTPSSMHVSDGVELDLMKALRYLDEAQERGDTECLDRVRGAVNTAVTERAAKERFENEVQERLNAETRPLGVDVNVHEIVKIEKNVYGVKLCVGGQGYSDDLNCRPNHLVNRLVTFIREAAVDELKRRQQIWRKFAVSSICWGLEEKRLLISSTGTTDQRDLCSFDLAIADAEPDVDRAFGMISAYLKSWKTKKLMVEDLSGLTEVKAKLDGPIAAETAEWKQKIEVCAKLEPLLKTLNIPITVVKATPETYTTCSECGRPLTKDLRFGHHHPPNT
jgi:hypothetical protein